MIDLPDTTQWNPRPVFGRFLARHGWEILGPPTEEEMADAIACLRDLYPPTYDVDEVLLREAERIMVEVTESGIFTADEPLRFLRDESAAPRRAG